MTSRRAVLFAGCLLACTAIGWAQECLEAAGGLLSGETRAVDARGSLVFMGDGALLRVIDLSSPNAPVEVASLKLDGRRIQSLAVDGDRIYVGTWQFLHIVDVSTPAVPVELGVLPSFGVKYALGASGDTVCIVTSSELAVVDVSDPANPVVAGFWSGSRASDVEVVGDHAYVTTVSGLRILDLSNPSLPTQVGSVSAPNGNLDVSGNLAYIEGKSDFLRIYDVSNPTAPSFVTEVDLSLVVFTTDVAVQGDLAFVSSQLNGLMIVDVSDPLVPVWIGSALPPVDRPNEKWIAATSIEDYAVVATLDHGIRVIDTTVPATPVEVAVVDSLGYTYGAAISNEILVLASGDRGITTVDVTDPLLPRPLAALALGPFWWVRDVDVAGSLVVAVGMSFAVVDISDPSNPTVIGETPMWQVQGYAVKIVGDLAYVADPADGLRIIDISNPTNPTEVGSLTWSGDFWVYLDVAGSLVALQGPRIEIIDVSNPAAPTSVSSINLGSTSRNVALDGSWLFAAGGTSLHTFDLSDPALPAETNVFFEPREIASLGVRGSVLYVGSYVGFQGVSELEAWNVGDPSTPVLMGERLGTGDVVDLALGEEYVFTARLMTGFETFSLCQGPLFADGFESGDPSAWSGAVP